LMSKTYLKSDHFNGGGSSPSFQRYQVLSLLAYRDFMWIDIMGGLRDGNARRLISGNAARDAGPYRGRHPGGRPTY
jgi:hypothetical protein